MIDLTLREISNRLSHSALGLIWLVITPTLLLAVYAFVFGTIFEARSPEGFGLSFVVWLALGLWPWFAFSESVLRAAQAIRQHSALISKIAINRSILVISVLSGTFLLHVVGYVVVLVILGFYGINLDLHSLPYALVILLTLYGLAVGFGLLFASMQVFLRDLEQLLPVLFMLWFFLTPILYAPELLPEGLQHLLWLNPMTWWVEELREALVHGKVLPDFDFLWLVSGMGISLLIGGWVFNRLSPYFEDFL